MEKGRIEFECSDKALTEGFAWAKAQALEYSHENDPVGSWYEAALPGREAFCMRDVSHQTRGAHVLGLEEHNKNMLLRFAQSISESRDFCCFWEINRYYRPAPVDYTSDADFWYNLTANFDVIDACFRMYKLTGDRDYIDSTDFRHFYDLSMNEYIKKWDINGDGIPEGTTGAIKRRGICSYEEVAGKDSIQMADLPAAEQKAMRDYAEIKKLQGNDKAAAEFAKEADRIAEVLDKEWWDESEKGFYMFRFSEKEFGHINPELRPFEYVMYFDAVKDPRKQKLFLDDLYKKAVTDKMLVESLVYFCEIFYNYGQYERGLEMLRKMVSPELKRREYPEVSYTAAGNYIFGLMGIVYDVESGTISVNNHLPEEIKYASVKNLPVYGKEADVTIENGRADIKMH